MQSLPGEFHDVIQRSYGEHEAAEEIIVNCLHSSNVDTPALAVPLKVLQRHFSDNFSKSLEPMDAVRLVFRSLLNGSTRSSFEGCLFTIRKLCFVVERCEEVDDSFQEWAVSSLTNTIGGMDSREEAFNNFLSRLDISRALSYQYPSNVTLESAQIYFETNSYLLSDEVFPFLSLPYTGLGDPTGASLPWCFNVFTSIENQVAMVSRVIDTIKKNLPLSSLPSQGPVRALSKLLRIWNVIHPSATSCTVEDLFSKCLCIITGDVASELKVSKHIPVVEDCYMSLLELAASTDDIAAFIDILLGDLLYPLTATQANWIDRRDRICLLSQPLGGVGPELVCLPEPTK